MTSGLVAWKIRGTLFEGPEIVVTTPVESTQGPDSGAGCAGFSHTLVMSIMFPAEAQSSQTACPRLHSRSTQSPDLSLEMTGSKACILSIPGHLLQSSHVTHQLLAFPKQAGAFCNLCSFTGMSSVIPWDQCFPVHQLYLSTWQSLSLNFSPSPA